jgi:hypothetical protein
MDEALQRRGGRVLEWVGEPQLRSLIRGKTRPVPDALVHWRRRRREGTFFLEWDRGTEVLATLTAKLGRYAAYARSRGHRQLLPGLGLRPRLVIVASPTRAHRLVTFIRQHPIGLTVLVGVPQDALHDPLQLSWSRSDLDSLGSLER